MTKIWTTLAVVSVIGLVLFFLYREGEKKGINSEIIKQQEQQIEIKNEVIETKKFQQKIISKTSVNVDAASRDKWVQLLFQERASVER